MSRKKINNYKSDYETHYKRGYNYDKRVILSKLDKIDDKINKIDDDLNSNPFTRLFRKHNLKYVLMFFITCLIMVVAYVYLIFGHAVVAADSFKEVVPFAVVFQSLVALA